MKKLSAIAIIVIVISSFTTQNEKTTIMFFGDSITAGYGLDKSKAFPNQVKQLLENQGDKVTVINAGLSGETSAGGLNRIDWVLRQPIDIFILELGPNDGLRGLPLKETKKNLQEIINRVKKKYPDVKIVIAGMMVPPNLGDDYTREFKNIFPALAEENEATLIPFLLEGVAGDSNLNLSDGIHPNAEGHKIISENLLKYLKNLL